MTSRPLSPLAIFDLDGTLVDTAADLVSSLNHTIAAAGLAPVTYDDLTHLVGQGADGVGDVVDVGVCQPGVAESALHPVDEGPHPPLQELRVGEQGEVAPAELLDGPEAVLGGGLHDVHRFSRARVDQRPGMASSSIRVRLGSNGCGK